MWLVNDQVLKQDLRKHTVTWAEERLKGLKDHISAFVFGSSQFINLSRAWLHWSLVEVLLVAR